MQGPDTPIPAIEVLFQEFLIQLGQLPALPGIEEAKSHFDANLPAIVDSAAKSNTPHVNPAKLYADLGVASQLHEELRTALTGAPA